MKVKDLIERLQKFNPELPVCFSHEDFVHEIDEVEDPYYGPYHSIYSGPKLIYKTTHVMGSYVLLGEFGDMVDEDKYEQLTDGGFDNAKIYDSTRL